MNSDDEKVQVSHLVPKQLKEDAKEEAEHGELSEAVREAYRIVAYGDDHDDVARLRHKLERAKNEYTRLTEEREILDEDIEEAEARIRRLREQLESVEEEEDQYEDHLQQLEEQLLNGSHLFEDHGVVQEAADVGDVSAQQVLEDLRERNPDVPDHAFKPAHRATFEWTGIDSSP